METNKGMETFYAESRQDWRTWLEKNNRSKKEICLVMYHKKSNKHNFDHETAVDEAMCFGWIDSVRNKRDHESFYQRFSPRKPNSNWSERSKERYHRLVREGFMTRHGQETVDVAKEKGKW